MKYTIGQIIKWEDKEKYFWNYKYPQKEKFDLLNMMIINNSKPSIFNSPIGMFFKEKKENDFKELEKHDIKIIVKWVKRPHAYNIGDIVNIDFAISEVSE